MNRTFQLPVLMVLLAVGLAAPAQDSSDKTQKQMTKLYTKLALTLNNGKPPLVNTVGNTSPESMLILSMPGIPIATDRKSDDPLYQNYLDLLNMLGDQIPLAQPTMVASAQTYSNLYGLILSSKLPLPFPPNPLQKKDQDILDAALAETKDDNPDMQEYTAAQKEYNDKLSAKNDWMDSHPGRRPNSNLTDDLATAKAKVERYQNTIYKDLQVIQTYTAQTGLPYWESLQKKYDAAASESGATYETDYYPDPDTWGSDDGWMEFHFKGGDKITASKAQQTNIDASLSGHAGKLSIDAKFAMNSLDASDLMNDDNFALSFQIKRVSIYRNWLDFNVFSNSNWTWMDSHDQGQLSYGTIAQNATQACKMPVYTTTLFLARKIHITAKSAMDFQSKHNDELKAGATVTLGPWTVSGGYDRVRGSAFTKSTFSDTGIDCDGVQIIGWLGVIPPKSPNPDLTKLPAPQTK